MKEVEDGIEHVLKLAYEAAEGGSGEAWLFLGDLYLVSRPSSSLLTHPSWLRRPRLSLTLAFSISQTGHLSLTANPVQAVEAYTKASEGWGIPEAQYKLGFLYDSNFANATGPTEGLGEQGSVSLLS